MLIKNTISIYQQCFSPSMSSACIGWAMRQLEGFNTLLTRQLSSVQRGTSVWDKCLEIVHSHADMLSEVGVDFGDLVARGLGVNGEERRERPKMTRSESLISGLAEAAKG